MLRVQRTQLAISKLPEPCPPPTETRLELPNGALSPEQQNHFSPIVFSRIDLGTNLFDSLSISDSDNNGELSVGDVLEGNYFDGQIGQTVTHTVTQSDIDGYLNTTAEELNLSQKQHDAIRYHFDDASALAYDGQAVEYTGTAIDKDGDNKLSVGDTVKLRTYGYGMGGLYESFKDHTLTRDDVAAISDFSSKDTIDLSGAEKSQLRRAIISESIENLPGVSKTHIDSVIDKDGDGKLSVGDAIKTKITPNGGVASTEKTQFQTLTEAKLDRYNAGISYDSPRLEFELSANQDKTIRERFNIAEGVGNYYVLDADSNNKLSVGDQLAYFADGTSNPFSGPDAPYLSHILTTEDIAAINGETNIPDVKLEANKITVDGQSFTPKVPTREVVLGTLIISPDNDSQREEIRQSLESFASHGIEITREFSSLPGFVIEVPEQYTGHWAAALEAILPSQPLVSFNGVNYAHNNQSIN